MVCSIALPFWEGANEKRMRTEPRKLPGPAVTYNREPFKRDGEPPGRGEIQWEEVNGSESLGYNALPLRPLPSTWSFYDDD
jgi:hypothetical protein